MRATLEHEGTHEGDESLDPPELSGDEPVVLDLFFRLRRSTPADQPVSIDTALRLHELLVGELDDVPAYLEEIEAMDVAFQGFRSGEIERRSQAGKPKTPPDERRGF